MVAAAGGLLGRSTELATLEEALRRCKAGASAALVLRGDAGIGKTTLLDHVAGKASGCQVIQLAGVESEIELPFAALEQLLTPTLGRLEVLPEPQREALRITFGQVVGAPPDRFVVGLAALGLLAEAASVRPVVCLVDDAQWLDAASAQVFGFVARRLAAESVLMIFAVRDPAPAQLFAGLPALHVRGLADDDARAVLEAANPGRLDSQVRDRIVAETGGNPLALLELSRTGRAELLGGFAVPAADTSDLEDRYVRRIRRLPIPTRLVLLVASADPTGDPVLLWRAARQFGLGPDAATPAREDRLVEVDARVRFRHPLIRSAAYAAGSPEDRRRAHAALAAALAPDDERRVWHLAAATDGVDDEVAAILAGAARRAEARGGLAAAALLQRSAALTDDPALRTERTLAAAQAHLDAGAFAAARALLPLAEADAVDPLQRARADLIRGRTDRAAHSGRDAPVALLRAAQRLQQLDTALARSTYLDAWGAALVAGSLAGPGAGLAEVSAAASQAPRTADPPRPADHLLDGLATLITAGPRAAEPMLRRAVEEFLDEEVSADQWLHAGVLVADAALVLWDYDSWEAASVRHVELARRSGALAPLANALNACRVIALWRGDVAQARTLGVEEQTVKDVTGTQRVSYGDLFLLAYRGHADQADPLIAAAADEATARGEGLGVQITDRATALLQLGLGRYAEAATAAARAAAGNLGPFTGQALPDLVEAAARSRDLGTAERALERLTGYAAVTGSDWAAGLLARSRALLADGADAEPAYVEAVECLGRTRLRFELARARLVYGEWLRRERRRADARHQLKAAFDDFAAMGADGFAERARHELLATGEKVRKRSVDTLDDLTPQEEQIARMARAGRTNPEIGAELYLSSRTVEWHLRKVFAKLGITSRRELRNALPARPAGPRR